MCLSKHKLERIVIYFTIAIIIMGFAAYIGTNYLIKASVEDNNSGTASQSGKSVHFSGGQSFIANTSSTNYWNYEGYIQATYSPVSLAANDTPIATAGNDTTVYVNTSVTLDGAGSSDPNGDQITYQWTQTSGNSVSLSNSTSSQATFTPTVEGTYIFQLTVTDTGGLSATDQVTITVNYKYLLGDFDTDKDIDFDDLTQFAYYWKNDNTSGDIGPKKSGEVAPFYSEDVSLDHKLDFDDLVIFTFNWDYLVDHPASAPYRASFAPAIARAITGSIQFDLQKSGKNRYKIISNGSGDFLGCKIKIDGINCNIQTANLLGGLAQNKCIMLTRNKGPVRELNIVRMAKNDYYISPGTEVAELEVEGSGDIVMSYLVKDSRNQAVSYAIEQYSTAIESEKEVAGTLVGQNFPNPFNPETWIPFTLSEPASVKIVIYNLVGQKIRELSLGYRQAGEYKTKETAAFWDGYNESGDEVASGIYFYKLIAGGYSGIKRMVVLK